MSYRAIAIRSVKRVQRNVKKALDEKRRKMDCDGKSAFVGLRGTEKNDEGVTIALYGAVHEFGRGNQPERSFLRVPLWEKRQEIYNVALEVFEAGGGCEPALNAMGLTGVNISVDSFDKNDWPPNKPETVRRKGSAKVLVDNGDLRGAIDYVVSNRV